MNPGVARAPALALALSILGAGCGGDRGHEPPPGTPALFAEHYAHSVAALGYPGARRSFQVGDGWVVSSGDASIEWRLGGVGDSLRISPVAFEADGVPIAHGHMRSADLELEYEAAAAHLAALGDSSLALSVRVTARAAGASPRTFVLEAQVRSRPEGPHFVPWDARPRFTPRWADHAAMNESELVALVDDRFQCDPSPSGLPALLARCPVRLAPGETRHWDFWLPLHPTRISPAALRGATHDRAIAEARRWWRETLARAARLETPDHRIDALWRASLVTLVLCHERDRDQWVPIGNPFQYRDVWIRDGARLVRALAVAGLDGYARDDALTLAAFQLPSGALLSQRGQLDGTGQALWAFDQASALAASDGALARRIAPAAARALRWIERQHEATQVLSPRWPGLLPYGDPRDGELVHAQLVGNDAWAIAGCDAVGRLARRAGDAALAARADSDANTSRERFAAALARAASRDVPPSWQGVGRDWGNLSAGYPTRALPAADPRLAALARRLSTHGTDGLTSYGSDDSLHTYAGSDLAQSALLADRPGEAQRWLEGLLAHSSSTLGQAEIFNRRDGGFGINLPPHGTAAAMLVDLLRNMMVSDDDDTLRVGLGASLRWWDGARLTGTRTRFGIVSVALERPAPDRLRARITPVPVPLRLRVPDGLRGVSVETAGARLSAGRWIDAPPRTASIAFSVAPDSSRSRTRGGAGR